MQQFNSKSKGFFEILGVVIILIGFIAGYFYAAAFGNVTKIGLYSTYTERDWGLTIGIFIGVVCTSVIWGMLMIAISEVLTALESICNNVANMGSCGQEQENVTSFSARDQEQDQLPNQKPNPKQESSVEKHLDAVESERESMYRNACKLMLSQKSKYVENAMNLFESIKDYKDSNSKVDECREILSNIRMHEKKITSLLVVINVIIICIGVTVLWLYLEGIIY